MPNYSLAGLTRIGNTKCGCDTCKPRSSSNTLAVKTKAKDRKEK